MDNTLYWQKIFTVNQLKAVLRTFVAAGCIKMYTGGVNLQKFLKEMKDTRQLSVSSHLDKFHS